MDNPTAQLFDLGLVAALISFGFELAGTTRDASGRMNFVFFQSDKLDRAVSAYWADTLEVKARSYSDNIKALKSRIYSER